MSNSLEFCVCVDFFSAPSIAEDYEYAKFTDKVLTAILKSIIFFLFFSFSSSSCNIVSDWIAFNGYEYTTLCRINSPLLYLFRKRRVVVVERVMGISYLIIYLVTAYSLAMKAG